MQPPKHRSEMFLCLGESIRFKYIKEGGVRMPNHITNIIELECSGERSMEIMEFLKAEGQDYGKIGRKRKKCTL